MRSRNDACAGRTAARSARTARRGPAASKSYTARRNAAASPAEAARPIASTRRSTSGHRSAANRHSDASRKTSRASALISSSMPAHAKGCLTHSGRAGATLHGTHAAFGRGPHAALPERLGPAPAQIGQPFSRRRS